MLSMRISESRYPPSPRTSGRTVPRCSQILISPGFSVEVQLVNMLARCDDEADVLPVRIRKCRKPAGSRRLRAASCCGQILIGPATSVEVQLVNMPVRGYVTDVFPIRIRKIPLSRWIPTPPDRSPLQSDLGQPSRYR